MEHFVNSPYFGSIVDHSVLCFDCILKYPFTELKEIHSENILIKSMFDYDID